jgi:FkbM family methyltransferase
MAPEVGSWLWRRQLDWHAIRGGRLLFVDCGGHNGSSVRKFRREFDERGRFEIATFEPNPEYASSFDGLPKHQLVQAAVADEDGEAPFYLDREDGDGSTLYRHKLTRHEGGFGELDRDDPIHVQLVDLSQWLQANVRRKDYVILKLDVEGAEYRVLPKLLADGTLRLVDELFIEWHWERVGVAREDHDRIESGVRQAGIRVAAWDAQAP